MDDDLDADDLAGYLDDLNDCGVLTAWEVDFVDDMLKRSTRNPDLWVQNLSEKQRAKIVELWNRRCG